jgi:hypothetical protein
LGRLELTGWIVFLLSGVAFLVSGILSGDVWVILGSTMFVAGVLAVMVGTAK